MPDDPDDADDAAAGDDGPITEADYAEARAYWASRPDHESTGTELFSSPVYGKGFRGDNPIKKDQSSEDPGTD